MGSIRIWERFLSSKFSFLLFLVNVLFPDEIWAYYKNTLIFVEPLSFKKPKMNVKICKMLILIYKRNWVFAAHSNVLTPISLQPDSLNLCYFKFRLFIKESKFTVINTVFFGFLNAQRSARYLEYNGWPGSCEEDMKGLNITANPSISSTILWEH